MSTTIPYDDGSVRRCVIASLIWGIVGVPNATQLFWWRMNGKFIKAICFGMKRMSCHRADTKVPIPNTHGSLLPGQKEEFVRLLDHDDALQLGDGANDSLAFNAAELGHFPRNPRRRAAWAKSGPSKC